MLFFQALFLLSDLLAWLFFVPNRLLYLNRKELCLLRVFGSPEQGSSAVFDFCFEVSTSLTGSGFLAALPHACACLNASTLGY